MGKKPEFIPENIFYRLAMKAKNEVAEKFQAMLDNDFADEGLDYFPFNTNVEHGGQASTNYYLSVPFAKKLCMLSKSERGEQARNYFIEVERRYQTSSQLPTMTQAQLIAGIAQIRTQNMAQYRKNSCGFQRTTADIRKAAGAYLTSIGGS